MKTVCQWLVGAACGLAGWSAALAQQEMVPLEESGLTVVDRGSAERAPVSFPTGCRPAWSGSIPGVESTYELDEAPDIQTARVFDLCIFDLDGDGPGEPALYAAGWFSSADGITSGAVARWTGSEWESIGVESLSPDALAPLPGLATFAMRLMPIEHEGAPALLIGGRFEIPAVGTDPVFGVIRYDSTGITPEYELGPGSSSMFVSSFFTHDDGQGERVFATLGAKGSLFNPAILVRNSAFERGIEPAWEQWSNRSWPFGLCDAVSFDDGRGLAMWIAGSYVLFSGGQPAASAVMGLTDPEFTGANVLIAQFGPLGIVNSLKVFDSDGSIGPQPPVLAAGGDFTQIFESGSKDDFIEANCAATWDGVQWRALGDNLDRAVVRLLVVPHPDGDELYAATEFDPSPTPAPAESQIGVWKYDGANNRWDPIGVGFSSGAGNFGLFLDFWQDPPAPNVNALIAPVLPGWPALIAGGDFGYADGVEAKSIAVLDETILVGDSNYDLVVGMKDIAEVLGNWGAEYTESVPLECCEPTFFVTVGPYTGPGDANRDSVVDFLDVVSALSAWGEACD